MFYISGKQKKAIYDLSMDLCCSVVHSLLDDLKRALEQLYKIATITDTKKISHLAAIIETCSIEIKDSLEREILIPSQEKSNEEECGEESSNLPSPSIVEAEEE